MLLADAGGRVVRFQKPDLPDRNGIEIRRGLPWTPRDASVGKPLHEGEHLLEATPDSVDTGVVTLGGPLGIGARQAGVEGLQDRVDFQSVTVGDGGHRLQRLADSIHGGPAVPHVVEGVARPVRVGLLVAVVEPVDSADPQALDLEDHFLQELQAVGPVADIVRKIDGGREQERTGTQAADLARMLIPSPSSRRPPPAPSR